MSNIIILVRLIKTLTREGGVKVPKLTLKAARINAGLTQKEAAKKLGVSYQTLSRYENEPTKMPVRVAIEACGLYKVNFDSLFFKN